MSRSEYHRGLGVGALGALSLIAGLRGAIVFLFTDWAYGLFIMGVGVAGGLLTWGLTKLRPSSEGTEQGGEVAA
jgi:hypothetical protein